MSAPNKAHLAAFLQLHIGKDRGITAAAIAVALGCNERQVRFMVTELREDGVAVCGHPASGYFVAANHQELEETCAFLRSRAMHSLVLESKLRHVPLPDLIGQLRLKT
jgi:biotin operon repressor